MTIAFVGRFEKLHDEEYIARSFEMLGHTVYRVPQDNSDFNVDYALTALEYDFLLFTKWEKFNPRLWKQRGVKTVCWLFDLYFDYMRQFRVATAPYFKADHVFTTDDGHEKEWALAGVNHHCVRQGIYAPECYAAPINNPHGVLFVGSNNPANIDRAGQLQFVRGTYPDFRWIGKKSTEEVRGVALNDLYATAKIVIGDSVYSPRYWSNRIVETLGRGGFLIHQQVPGLLEAYPYLVTYKRGNFKHLEETINYYLEHEDERQEIIQKNLAWVKERYTMDAMCADLISKV